MTPDGSLVWSIVGIVFSLMCGLLTFSYRKLYTDLEKLCYELKGEQKILVQRIHEIMLAQAEGKSVAAAVHELKDEIKKIRGDVYSVIRQMPSYRPPSRSQTNE